MNKITLSVSDLNTTISKGEPRIQDVLLGQRLGLAQPRDVRRTIDKNRAELEQYGSICAVRNMIETGKGAKRSVDVYYLNEPQALLLCMFARTGNAAEVRKEVISVYLAVRHGQQPALPEPCQKMSCGRAKLSDQNVLDIVALYGNGYSYREISDHMGCAYNTVVSIITGGRRYRLTGIRQSDRRALPPVPDHSNLSLILRSEYQALTAIEERLDTIKLRLEAALRMMEPRCEVDRFVGLG